MLFPFSGSQFSYLENGAVIPFLPGLKQIIKQLTFIEHLLRAGIAQSITHSATLDP